MNEKEMEELYPKVEGMLWNYTTLISEIKNLELDIEELENDYRGCGSITYEEKSSPTNAFNSPVENEVTHRDKKIKQLKDLKRLKEIQIEKVNNAFEELEEREKQVIKLKYFSNKKLGWIKIGELIGVSDVTCKTDKKKAIRKMVPIIFVSEKL